MAQMKPVRHQASGRERKSELFVISNSEQYLTQIEQATCSFYQIETFQSPAEMLDRIGLKAPCALIVDSILDGLSGVDMVHKVRKNLSAEKLPIVFTALASQRDFVKEVEKVSGVKTLEKPYRKTELLGAISGQVNSAVEASWDAIEPVQKAALKNSLDSFNSLADLISEGKPVEYSDVSGNCEALLEAVRNQNFKDILKGVQGHDNYSYVHSMRVATLLSLFGAAIGIKGDEHMTLTAGGLLHDVGKMAIPHEVLNKAGKLDDSEFDVMKSHVTHTLDFLS
jgi:HD-GYP domain-containing protein (c-di-GMP phosphodiesterase class II)